MCTATQSASRTGRARSWRSTAPAGGPPYLVRFDDGHTGLCFPGPDAVVEHAKTRAGKARASSAGNTKSRKK